MLSRMNEFKLTVKCKIQFASKTIKYHSICGYDQLLMRAKIVREKRTNYQVICPLRWDRDRRAARGKNKLPGNFP